MLSACLLCAGLQCAIAAAGVSAQQATSRQSVANDDLESCRRTEVDAERLSCYDRLYGRSNDELLQSPAAQNVPEAPEAAAREVSLLDQRWQLQPESKQGPFHMTPFKPVYILAAFHSSSPNTRPSSPGDDNTVVDPLNLSKTEAKYQISFKSKVWENVLGNYSDLWFAYTQSSRWQLYNSEESRPFRETDYEPEFMLTFRTNYSLLGWHGRLASIGINHQSNGRTEPLSRSWNRLMGGVGLERDGWTMMLRPWKRFSEDPADDDNPDIEDFMGRGDLLVTREWDGHEISAIFRHSLRGGDRAHASVEVDWAFPIWGNLSGYLQILNGYGESLIDYNRSATYVGLGVSLIDWYSSGDRKRR